MSNWIFYLLSIDNIHILPRLFGKVFIPDAVHRELCHPAAPRVVGEWAARLPVWIEVAQVAAVNDAALQLLDEGERSAIALAELLHADLILMDERKGTGAALSKGFEATGTLGVLDLAARRGFSLWPMRSRASRPRIFVTRRKSWTNLLSSIREGAMGDVAGLARKAL